jgi:transposase
LIGLDDRGAIVLREKIARGRITARLANVPRCLIGIEAGMATHYVARELSALGHDVKQVPPAYAKPFRQGHKDDFRDAHAIAEAVQRPSTRCVPVKTDDQLDLQALHRVRSRLVGQRTAVINQIRGFLLEHGIAVRQGLRFLRQQLPDILAKRSDVLSPRMIRIMEDLSGDWRRLDERIQHVTEEIEVLAHGSESCRQEMEKRSRRRIRDLVALSAFQGLSQNEIGCARISMMARSTNAPFKGRIQKRKTNHLQIITLSLQRTADPSKRANSGSGRLYSIT